MNECWLYTRQYLQTDKFLLISGSYSGAPREHEARASAAPHSWENLLIYPRSVTVHPLVRPHHRETNVKCHTFWLKWEPATWYCTCMLWSITRYPLTSFTWPYRGLRCRPIEIVFLKLSADKLLVFLTDPRLNSMDTCMVTSLLP